MKTKPILLCVAATALLGLALIGWLLRGGSPSQPEEESTPTPPSDRIVSGLEADVPEIEGAPAPERGGEADAEDSDQPKPQALLGEFYWTGDKADLEQAIELFPEDRLIMLQSALLADRPDAEELARLEEADPDNALPNLIRAGLYAESGNLERFKEELKTAQSKKKLSVELRKRQALLMDRIIAEEVRGLDPEIYAEFDAGVLDRLESTAKTLVRNPKLFGDEYDTAGYAMAYASKVRAMGGGRHGYGLVAGELERDALRRLDPQDEYGTDGQTIGQRLAELDRRVPALRQKVQRYYEPLMSPEGDPALRLQFFARVRALGEPKALDWLAERMDGR